MVEKDREGEIERGHPWVQVDGVAPDKPLDYVVLTMYKFKKMTLSVRYSYIREHVGRRNSWAKTNVQMIDTDNSGQITFEELKAELKRVGANLKESEIYDLILCHIIRNFARFDLGALKYLDIDGELVERSHKMNDLNRGEILQVDIIPDVNVAFEIESATSKDLARSEMDNQQSPLLPYLNYVWKCNSINFYGLRHNRNPLSRT
ncbi:calcium-dependent protein kinase 1-like protein [Tanacetum coccineum]